MMIPDYEHPQSIRARVQFSDAADAEAAIKESG
jgi:hypothetical protein